MFNALENLTNSDTPLSMDKLPMDIDYITLNYESLVKDITSCNDMLDLFNKINNFNAIFDKINEIYQNSPINYMLDNEVYTDILSDTKKNMSEKIKLLRNLLEDIKNTVEINIRDISETYIVFGQDRESNLLCAIADFKDILFKSVKEPIYVYILFGERCMSKDYGYMMLKYHVGKPVLELSSIKAGQIKRLHRGSFALNSIEKPITIILNAKINDFNKRLSYKEEDCLPLVNCIFGESGRLTLSFEIDKNARKRFYVLNGYKFNYSSSFYKFI